MRRSVLGLVIGLAAATGCSEDGAGGAAGPALPSGQDTLPTQAADGPATPMAPADAAGAPTGTPGASMDTQPPATATPGDGEPPGPQAEGTAGAEAADPAQDPAVTDPPIEQPPQTCAAGLAGQPGRETVRLQHGGASRNYILHVPASYDGASPLPLVLYFHPLLTNASTAATSSGFRELADREGFIVAFPDSAQSAAWNVGGICCTSSPDIDDVGFARAIVDDIGSRFCVDPKRVYASGFSMGGGMSHHLGCEAADVFAAIAPGAFDLFEESECTPARPITVISFRGTADAIVPFDGGLKTSAPNGFRGNHTFEGAEGTFARWGEINGCTGQPSDEGGGCKTHAQCSDGVEVTLCTAVGGGHTWPDAERAWQTLSRFALPQSVEEAMR